MEFKEGERGGYLDYSYTPSTRTQFANAVGCDPLIFGEVRSTGAWALVKEMDPTDDTLFVHYVDMDSSAKRHAIKLAAAIPSRTPYGWVSRNGFEPRFESIGDRFDDYASLWEMDSSKKTELLSKKLVKTEDKLVKANRQVEDGVSALVHALGHQMGASVARRCAILQSPKDPKRIKTVVFPIAFLRNLPKYLQNEGIDTSSAEFTGRKFKKMRLSNAEVIQLWGAPNISGHLPHDHSVEAFNVTLEFKSAAIDKLTLTFALRELDESGNVVAILEEDEEGTTDVDSMVANALN